MKTLRWPEPFNRTMHEIHNSNDTGLCNRLFHWEVAYELNRLNNFEYKIILEESKWPELKELITLPYTRLSPEDIDESEELKLKRIIGKSVPITKERIEQMFKWEDFDLRSERAYHSNFGHYSLPDLYNRELYDHKNRPIQNIELQDKTLDSMIKELTKDLVGIHMRRGRGIKYKEKLDTLSSEIKDDYIEFRELEPADEFYIYKFVTDEEYFKIIDSFLERNPNQKFYISHDLPDEIFDYYEKKYPNILYTKKYFYDYISDKFKNTNQNHVKNIVDLFSLSNTQFVIKHELSTWSEFAHYYTDKNACYFRDDVNYILDSYKSVI
jgi:hypothetical protein